MIFDLRYSERESRTIDGDDDGNDDGDREQVACLSFSLTRYSNRL